MVFSFLRNRRRKQLLAEPLPAAQRQIIERNVAVFVRLSNAEREKLIAAARIIAAERPFVPCGGQQINDEVKLTIAAQAALLLLGEGGYYFDKVPSILVYPMAYARRHSLGSASPVDEDAGMLGESWQRGSIVLSWPAVLSGGRDATDGQNLVLHEFAHHLDSLDGEMGGLPPLPTHEAEKRWLDVFGREFDLLCRAVENGQSTLLDPYGTTNKAEMFAVSTECFFERPVTLRERHPELYDIFREFYKLDPTTWFGAASLSATTSRSHLPRAPLPSEADDELDHVPESPAELPALETADQYFTRGHEFFELGRFDLAAADFNRCVRLQPDDQEAILWRGRAYLYEDHIDAALADAERACRLAPQDQEAKTLLAICLCAAGQFEESLAEFRRVRELDPEDIAAYFYRGIAHAERGQTREAIADFSRVIELDPHDAEAWHERGHCHEDLGNSSAAAADFAKARELGWETDDAA
jgi:Mlc titration factor MtfA (ptsG expression regulator)/Flp pilus assembly protein TadD